MKKIIVVPVAEPKYEVILVPANKFFGEPTYKIIRPNFGVYPSAVFESIRKLNPNGRYIKK